MGNWSVEVKGMDELAAAFIKLPEKARDISSKALYEGAGIVADALTREINGIKTAPFKYTKGARRLPSPEEKAIVTNARRGISKFKKGKSNVSTSVGFQKSGYGAITWNHAKTVGGSRTKYKLTKRGNVRKAGTVKRGQSVKPVAVIANAINSGTSFMQPQPFARKAFSQSAGAAAAAIEAGIAARLDELKLE